LQNVAFANKRWITHFASQSDTATNVNQYVGRFIFLSHREEFAPLSDMCTTRKGCVLYWLVDDSDSLGLGSSLLIVRCDSGPYSRMTDDVDITIVVVYEFFDQKIEDFCGHVTVIHWQVGPLQTASCDELTVSHGSCFGPARERIC
jgi:hypothetical protein